MWWKWNLNPERNINYLRTLIWLVVLKVEGGASIEDFAIVGEGAGESWGDFGSVCNRREGDGVGVAEEKWRFSFKGEIWVRKRRRKVGMSKNGEWKLKVAIASSIVAKELSQIDKTQQILCVNW